MIFTVFIFQLITSETSQLSESFDSWLNNFQIVSALLNFIDSADYMVGMKAMDALLVTCALPDKAAAVNAVQEHRNPFKVALLETVMF